MDGQSSGWVLVRRRRSRTRVFNTCGGRGGRVRRRRGRPSPRRDGRGARPARRVVPSSLPRRGPPRLEGAEDLGIRAGARPVASKPASSMRPVRRPTGLDPRAPARRRARPTHSFCSVSSSRSTRTQGRSERASPPAVCHGPP